ncbi:hypothetical protein H6F76_06580 [Leptolyngbya sp. FACHB-321]|uniref:hypothetical protein n=1 Tax=Leptolyngbya sp. FACHB-321 TaxID=2692807 RepID=UPI001684A9AD|nr:hypothetical protein [Leptolyngbya sp. FACHB-321]MBD2034698.1 hypothetical protein [Leptolyngbya sp. FACHB-321]
MQDKQKVTLYLPPELHRQIKIRAALDSETMTDIAQRAIAFYLSHSELVDGYEGAAHGKAYQIYTCNECSSPSILKDGELVSLRAQSGALVEEKLPSVRVKGASSISAEAQGEGSLVPC